MASRVAAALKRVDTLRRHITSPLQPEDTAVSDESTVDYDQREASALCMYK
jgi:hypothetical protein